MQFAGRIVADAELRATKTGQNVTDFRVALNDNYKKKDGTKIQRTTYFDCSVWNRPNLTQHLTKGSVVQVTGFPSPRAWTGKDGEIRAGIECRVDNLDFLGGPKRANENPAAVGNGTNASKAEGGKDDDLPF